MTQIWQHVYENELVVDPHEHPVLLTQSCNNPVENMVKTSEIFFEHFNIENLFIGKVKLYLLL
jgi:actin-related protein